MKYLAIAAMIAAVVGAIIQVVVFLRSVSLKKAIRNLKNWIPFLFMFISGLSSLWLWTQVSQQHPVPPTTVYDFENNMQGWGEHPEGSVHVSGQGVEVYRDNLSPISKTGNSSLKFIPTKIIKNNAYITVLENAQGTTIKAHIFVPSGANISTAQNNSTARIIVWDKNWIAHESDFIELDSGVWQSISWNLHGQEWPGPWREFGIHFYFVTDYKGPIYIDTVTLE